MRAKYLVAGLVSLGLMAEGAAPALAGGSDVVGGIIGGIIGGAIVNEANKSRPRTVYRTAPAKPAVSSYQRDQNREVQTSLNYFGYPVGTPDGVLGAKSRAAISQYQALIGYPSTGELTEMERQILVSAYNRAMIGGPQVQQAAAGPQGIRGMLLRQRDEMMGGGAMGGGTYASNSYGGLPPEVASAVDEISRNSGVEGMQLIQRAGFIQLADMNNDGRTDYLIDTAKTGSGFWCNGAACTVEVFASTPSGYQRNDFQLAGATPASFSCLQGACSIVNGGAPTAIAAQPAMPAPMPAQPGTTMVGTPAPAPGSAMPGFATQVAQPAAPAAPAMPSFGSAMAAPKVTLVSYCAGVKAKGGANGAPQTVALMNDPAQALGEQFCQVSAAVKDEGETLAKGIQGFTPEQIADQCRGFGAALKDQVALIETTPRDDMIASIQGWIAQSGMPEDQLVGTAKVCLGMGYGLDEPEVALASALVLSGTGNMVYAELIGHHLASGVGIDRHADLALDWYDLAGNALSIGQTPVFLPDQPDRAALIHKAAMALNGRAEAAPVLPVPVSAPAPAAGATPGGLVGFAGAAANLIATGAAKIPAPAATSAP